LTSSLPPFVRSSRSGISEENVFHVIASSLTHRDRVSSNDSLPLSSLEA